MNREYVKFLTGNKHKFQEAYGILSPLGLEIEIVDAKGMEFQDDDINIIASSSAKVAKKTISGPLIVEDAGLFIRNLNNFPGPYSSYVYKTLGCEGILKLMADVGDRNAEFRSAVAYIDDVTAPVAKIFSGSIKGVISYTSSGINGFGFDPIFVPTCSDLTFGEMELGAKSKISHRGESLRLFASWYLANK